MAGGFYYLLQQCGTLNTAIGSSSLSGLVGSFYYDPINFICWEVTSTDTGPIYTVDIDTLLGILDCNDPVCLPPSPTPTPTLCSCGDYTYVVDPNDVASATGNTNGYNGIVFWEYTDCSGNFVQQQYGSSGSHNECLCVNLSTYYWQNDAMQATTSSPSYNGPCAGPSPTPTPTPNSTPGSTPASTPSPTSTPTPTNPAVWYQIFDCNDSSVGYSIAYTAGAFSNNERCLAVNVVTRTVIVIGFTTTLPGGTLYTLTSLGSTGCPSGPVPSDTPTSTPTETPTPTPNSTPASTPSATSTPTVTPTLPCLCEYYDLDITSSDILSATGNTGPNLYRNGVVFVTYRPCSGGTQTLQYTVSSYYANAICHDNAYGIVIDVWQDNIQISYTSSAIPTGNCCSASYGHFMLQSGSTSCEDVCSGLGPSTTIYTTGATINVGDHFYSDAALTIDAVMAYYSDGVNCYDYNYSSNGANTAYCGSITPCGPTPTPTTTQTPTPSITASPTQTPTPSVTIGLTPTATETQTPTPSITPSETPTQTPTETVTPTPSITASETPTQTPTETVTPTPSITASPTETMTPTPSETPTQTPSETPTQTPTETPTQTPTQTMTPTPSETPTQTPTVTASPTPTPTLGYAVQFVDCSDNTNIFRFNDPAIPSTLGVTYYITGSTSFEGCATTVLNDGTGPQYNGAGVSFLMTGAGCGDPICPRSSNKAALLTRCSDGAVFYFNVEEDTAFVGAAYVYSGVCYSFVEFSGPGGDNIGSPLYKDCIECLGQPTPTPTPYVTPTNTPTVSATPPPCPNTTFCLRSSLPSLINYNGNYSVGANYNTKPTYSGDGITPAVIYYTGDYWCLSDTLGGSCILQGASPCYSQCPDIAANYFSGGVCPTPTPTPIDCNTFNFNAYFDCDWEPLPTPTPSIACDDVNFIIESYGVTPTPSPTGIFCSGKAISFSMSGYTPPVTPTVTLTPSVTLTRTVGVQGQATFNMLDETFSCTSVKVLVNCNTGKELYTSSNLVYDGTTVITGMTFFASINEENVCVTYLRDDSNFSSNSIVSQIFEIYNSCGNCSNVPSPTPTLTQTPSPTPSATAGLTPTPTATPETTPTQTATNTPTPSQTSTLGSTPTQTPSTTATPTPSITATQTQTPTNSPTPSITKSPTPTPLWVYVYQSCDKLQFGKFQAFAQVVQTQPTVLTLVEGQAFKDNNGNCWTYNGRFNTNYLVPQGMYPITFEGDYFSIPSETIYASCDDCLTPSAATKSNVTGVGGYMQPCIGGTIDDFMGAYVNLDLPVTADTTFQITVYYQYGNSGIFCNNNLGLNNSTSFTVFIAAGEQNGYVDACTNGQYFSTGAIVCGGCVSSSDNPDINLGLFGC